MADSIEDLARRVKELEAWRSKIEAAMATQRPMSFAEALVEQNIARVQATTDRIRQGQ